MERLYKGEERIKKKGEGRLTKGKGESKREGERERERKRISKK